MTPKSGDNVKDFIIEMAVEYAECDKESQALNDRRKEIRDKMEDKGLDKKAWQDAINRAKKDLKKRDGYDESLTTINNALGQLDMEELWSHVIEREEAKEAAREERKKAKAAEKANDDEYKPAPERKPKAVKSIGEQQADAILKARSDQAEADGETIQQAYGDAL